MQYKETTMMAATLRVVVDGVSPEQVIAAVNEGCYLKDGNKIVEHTENGITVIAMIDPYDLLDHELEMVIDS